MNSEMGNNSNKKDQLSQILNQLREEGKFQGILLSYRNGEPICISFNENLKDMDGSELSSMCASVLEGANNLKNVIGEESLTKIVAELNSYIFLIIQCDKDVFLTLIADFNSDVKKVLDSIERIIKKILLLY
jgi:predicted regulator of Ras-like GTPase activity (Roadblock/LC7/MglB family)